MVAKEKAGLYRYHTLSGNAFLGVLRRVSPANKVTAIKGTQKKGVQ